MPHSNPETSVLLRVMRDIGVKFVEKTKYRKKFPVFVGCCPFCACASSLIVNVNSDTWGCTNCLAGMVIKEYAAPHYIVQERPKPVGDIFDFMQEYKHFQSLEQTVYYLQDHYQIFGEPIKDRKVHASYGSGRKISDYDVAEADRYVVHLTNWR